MTFDNYKLVCDDFFADMYLNTKLELPAQRDTLLAFFERIQRQYPSMCNFKKRVRDYYSLEDGGGSESSRWISMEPDRLSSGVVNPAEAKSFMELHKTVLELAPYMLSISPMDIDSLDFTYSMDFDFEGNHDEIIAEALLKDSPLFSLSDLDSATPIDISPGITYALSKDCRLQARISVESKTAIYYPSERRCSADDSITLTLTIRQHPGTEKLFEPLKSLDHQLRIADQIMAEKIVPYFARPLMDVITEKRLN